MSKFRACYNKSFTWAVSKRITILGLLSFSLFISTIALAKTNDVYHRKIVDLKNKLLAARPSEIATPLPDTVPPTQAPTETESIATTASESIATQSPTDAKPTTSTEKADVDACSSHCINYFEKELSSLFSRFEDIEADVIALQSKSSELEYFKAEMEVMHTDLASVVYGIKSSALTNIRLGDLERAVVYQQYGYQDLSEGYVITSVINYNNDSYVDFVERRKIEIYIDGTWVGIV